MKTLNPKDLAQLVKEKFDRFNLNQINTFLEKLYGYKFLFDSLSANQQNKSGFTENHKKVYLPYINSLITKAATHKSSLLMADQLPGQASLFGLGKPFDDARMKGEIISEGIHYKRQNTIKNIILGKKCRIAFTLNKSIEGSYAIISADELQPSHLGSIQNPLHFIPEAQPRNRAMSQSGHTTPKIIAENLRPAEIVEGATAYTGASVVNTRGEVIQGNGRGFTIKYYYANFPDDPQGYKKWIKENSLCYGFTGSITKITNPVIVRMVNVTDSEAIELGQFTQKDIEAVTNETTAIKSKVGLLTDKSLDAILNDLLSKDTGEESLSELIRLSSILSVLSREQIIRKDDFEIYARNGIINETGVNFVTKFLLNLIFKDGDVNTPDIFVQLPVALQKSIEKSALYILKCRGDQSINKEVSNAILGLREYLSFKANGSINEWKAQKDIFNNSVLDKYTALEFKLIEIFADSTSQKQIIEHFKKYASFATIKPGDMFEDERPALSKPEAVFSTWGIKIETVDKRIKAIEKAKLLAKTLYYD